MSSKYFANFATAMKNYELKKKRWRNVSRVNYRDSRCYVAYIILNQYIYYSKKSLLNKHNH